MPKTDDVIKQELTDIGNYKDLHMRGFIGSSNYDQELWVDGGLTFRFDGKSYGSNDFAWYKEEKWIEPETNIECDCRPVIVVEGTDCLNTRSYGTAQIQRFHHVYGPFMNGGIIGIYYLKEGEYQIRDDLSLAAYYANFVENYKNRKCAYLVTDQIDDIKKMVKLVGDYGEQSDIVWNFIDSILEKMKQHYLNRSKSKNYTDYLNKHYIYKRKDGSWIKYIGAKDRSFLDSSIRYGHIVLGEAFVAYYLLSGQGLLNKGQKIKYYFPLISNKEFSSMKSTLTKDKEFLILTNSKFWDFTTFDNVEFFDENIKKQILPFKDLNLNDRRKEWNVVRKNIENSLKKEEYKIKP